MVVFNDAIEEGRELIVGLSRAGVHTDARVDVLAARENTLLEGDTSFVARVLVTLPDFLRQVLAQQRLSAFGELRHAL